MNDSWRFRPLPPAIQSNICHVCATSHFPFCPPPPAYPYLAAAAAVDHHRRFPFPSQPDLNPHPYPVRDPNPLPHSFHPPNRFLHDELLDRDGFWKRMRVEDPHPLPPPLPPPRVSFDDERRLSLIREHGRQESAPVAADRSFNNPTSSFDGYQKYQDFHRVLPPMERRDFYGREVESFRNAGSSWSRLDESCVDERQPVEFRPPPPVVHNGQFYTPNERSSYALPKQAQYPHSESFHMIPPKIACDEQESSYSPHYPPHYPSALRLPENKIKLQYEQRTHFEPKPPVFKEIRRPIEPYVNSMPYESNEYRMGSMMADRAHTSQAYPPLPPHPPLPPPPEPSPPPHFQDNPLIQTPPPMRSPVPPTSSAPLFPTQVNSQSALESRSLVQFNLYNEAPSNTSTGFVTETPSKEYMEGRWQTFPQRLPLKDEPMVIDACHLFRQPHRASRPDHIVVILRGLPGSGKSYLAKALRDLEVESGGNAPRIHAMDDYFMIEVEQKVEENEGSKSSGSSRSKKLIAKKVIEYCYEPEMEEAYRSSMLKAFKKTLDEGNFTFIIVDDRNLRVADFAQFWAIAKRSGYEAYLLEATYKDPTGCAARNVYGFTVEDIQKMAEQWEEAPSLYLQLDIQSLFRGDNLNEQSIQEVDMDTDDAACDEEEAHKSQQNEDMKVAEPSSLSHTVGGFVKIGERWNADEEEEEELTRVNDLRSSKWSKDVVEDIDNSDVAGGNLSALSGLIQAYGKSEKSVHWGDRVEKSGFSIGAVKKQNSSSLIIGPGSGYNLSSNPLREDEDALQPTGKSNINESKRRFTEQLRAERESFKAVFDRRRQRIGGLWDAEDEY